MFKIQLFKTHFFKTAGLLSLLFMLAFVAGCDRYTLQPVAQEDVILAFGDSLTAGKGVQQQHSYPAVLGRLANRNVINAGINGETTQQALARLPAVLAKFQPKLVILFSGGNDFLRKVPVHQTKANLQQMLELIQQSGASVLLVGVPEKKLFADSAELYTELSEDNAVPLQDEIVANLMVRASMKSDFVHFNEKGYHALAEAIYQSLISSGALTAN